MKRFILLFISLLLTYCGGDSSVADSSGVVYVESISKDTSVEVGSTLQLEARAVVKEGISDFLKWKSSDSTISKVSDEGLVIGIAVGEATITISSVVDETKFVSLNIEVIEQTEDVPSVDSVKILSEVSNIGVGDALNLVSRVYVRGGASDALRWSSSNSSIIVNANGVALGINEGAAVIIATSTVDSTKSASLTINVTTELTNQPSVFSLQISSLDSVVMVDSSVQLEATIVTQGGASRRVLWESSDPNIATVNNEGVVTGIAEGIVTITTTSDFDFSKTISTVIKVKAEEIMTAIRSPQVFSLLITSPEFRVEVDSVVQLNVVINAEEGASKEILWLSNNELIATVSPNGLVTARSLGTTVILAKSKADAFKFSQATIVVVLPPLIGSLSVSPLVLSLMVNQNYLLIAAVATEGGASDAVSWSSSDPSVATVTNNGILTAMGVGTSTITVASVFDPTKTSTSIVTVTLSPQVIPLSVSPSILSLVVSQSQQLTATVITEGGASDAVSWSSSDTSIVVVTNNGILTAIGAGTAIITVTSVFDPTKTSTSIVTVTLPPRVSGLSVSPFTLSLVVPQSQQLTATVITEGGASDAVSWSSSNPNVATVTTTGLVTTIGAGTSTITVTSVFDGTKTTTSVVTVTLSPRVSGLSVSPPTLSLRVNENQQLTANVVTEGGASDAVSWSSSDPNVATVTTTGIVTTIGAGTSTITVTSVFDGTKTTTSVVTVTLPPRVSGLSVSPPTLSLRVNENQQLTANVVTEGGASDAVSWSSSDPNVATVTTTGILTAIGAGTSTITVTSVFDGTKTSTSVVTVTLSPQVIPLSVSPSILSLVVSQSQQLTAMVVTEGGASDAVSWSSSDPNVATVTTTGLVTAIGAGTSTITVTSVFDGTKTATSVVTVTLAPRVSGLSVSPFTLSLVIPQSQQLTAMVVTEGGASDAVSWSSSNPSVATVTTTGLITARSAGTSTITVTSVFDGTKTSTSVVTVTLPPRVSGLLVSPPTLSLRVNESQQLTANVVTEGGASDAVSWSSSNPSVATVTTTGLVTTIGAGTSTITVSSVFDGTKTSISVVTVTLPPRVTSLSVSPSILSLVIPQSQQLTAMVVTEGGASDAVSWSSSNPSVATVTTTGLLTAIGAGTSTITVSSVFDGTKTSTSVVTVTLPPRVSGLSVSPFTLSLVIPQSQQLTAMVVTEGGASDAVSWSSSNPSVATVTTTGLLTAIGAGTSTITVTSVFDGTKTSTSVVTVTLPPRVSGLSVSPFTLSLVVSQSQQLTANVVTEGGASDAVSWSSSNPSVATVTTTGLVTTIGVGTAIITVTSVFDGTKTSTSTITVTLPPKVISVSMPSSIILAVNDQQLTAMVVTEGGASDAVSWSSSDTSVVTVTTTGLITARSAGTAIITVTSVFDGTKTATSLIAVTLTPEVTAVSVSPAQLTLKATRTGNLTVTVATEDGASDAVTWSSNDPSVATVDNNGLVTGIAEGTTAIVVRSSFNVTKLASVEILITAPPRITRFDINSVGTSHAIGATIQFAMSIIADSGVSQDVIWSLSDSTKATIDNNGLLRTVSAGLVRVTATSIFDSTKTSGFGFFIR